MAVEEAVNLTDIEYLQKIIYHGFVDRLAKCKQNSGKHFELFD